MSVRLNLFCEKCEENGFEVAPAMSNPAQVFAICDHCGYAIWLPIEEARRCQIKKENTNGTNSCS